MFHIEACTESDEIWTKFEDLFRKQDEMRGHMLEIELIQVDILQKNNLGDHIFEAIKKSQKLNPNEVTLMH
jgi:hypothetical protein